ncbi:hypothetical protein BASA61_010545 [Batrachochytrium salamandrivorans]|nr:hypothetical protein BASA61_010545 [Batrachochytrium salamandrivorans]KAH9276148.1 hypothetical protein BASA83_001422 [Batrachochytrium salamandrivorans]
MMADMLTLYMTSGLSKSGGIVHGIVSAVAESFLDAKGRSLITKSMQAKSLHRLADWGLHAHQLKKYGSTEDYHYMNTKDKPRNTCSFDDARDCPNGNCLVGAISKYTRYFTDTDTLSTFDLRDALPFLVHLLIDVSIPLHSSGREKNGRSVNGTYGTERLSFHSMFESSIPRQRINTDFKGTSVLYMRYLIGLIKDEQGSGTGSVMSNKSGWLTKHEITAQNDRGNSLAAIEWATEGNSISCRAIWPAYDANPDQNFNAEFYQKMIPMVDQQLAKAAYRLAFWINSIAALVCKDIKCVDSTSTAFDGSGGWMTLIAVPFMLALTLLG